VLVKAPIRHVTGGNNYDTYLPFLDCVADMQVIFGLDNDGDGDFEPTVSADGYSDDISAFTAQQIRDQVKEVRVYILAHEGQRDPNFTYTTNPVTVGEFAMGRDFDLAAIIGANWQNYRWKVYSMTVHSLNLLR
jgi:hypothetical protein